MSVVEIDICSPDTLDSLRAESRRLALECVRLRDGLRRACDLADLACACTSERGRSTVRGVESEIAELRRMVGP